MNKYIGIGAVCALLVFVSWFVWQQSDRDDGDGMMACTQEALVCPDGSFVGRRGPECMMEACPIVDFVEGKLVERDGGYWLVTAAPDTVSGATYIMPLEAL